MNIESVLGRTASGRLYFKTRGQKTRPVCSVTEACRLLHRTRRQLYRHISSGQIEVVDKWSGEWLLDRFSVERLARHPLAVQRIPRRLQALFPEHEVKNLNAGRDRTLVIARVLEGGRWKDLGWLRSRYRRREIADFIESEGARLLSPRSLRLWSLAFSVEPRMPQTLLAGDPWRRSAG